MDRLSIDEVIKHCKRHTERMESHSGRSQLEETPIGNSNIMKKYWEHRQVAEWLGELKTYKDAEEQGLLLRLPCKVGDTIYAIPSWVNFRLNKSLGHTAYNRVFPQIVDHIEFNSYGYWVSTCDGMQGHRQEAFGETWFLTREEAEQALKQMKGGAE